MNSENLKPIRKGDLSNEELKKRQSNGGKKSGAVRRAKRDAKQAIRYLLSLPPSKSIKANLEEMGFPADEQTNMAALQARLFAMAMSGNLEAYNTLMKNGGFEPEENRKERESLSSDRRREIELEAKVTALGNESLNTAINMGDEDGRNDVVIYLPEIGDSDEGDNSEFESKDIDSNSLESGGGDDSATDN